MRLLLVSIISIFIFGCSTSAIDMAPEPTVQVHDLKDYEGDGVIKARDICEASEAGSEIDNSGCGSQTVNKIRRKLLINFNHNSAIVQKKYFPEIESLAKFMKEYEGADVTIEGHTSKRGSKQHNQVLSKNRAQAIKDILVNQYHIAEQRVTAIGYGFEHLLLEGDDEYIHARNRRIVAEISSEERITDMKWHIYTVDEMGE